MCCGKKAKSRPSKKAAISVDPALTNINHEVKAAESPKPKNRLRAAKLQSQEDQKTIMVGTIAQIIYNPEEAAKNGPVTAIPVKVEPELVKPKTSVPPKEIAIEKPMEQTATDRGIKKTAETQADSLKRSLKSQKEAKKKPIVIPQTTPKKPAKEDKKTSVTDLTTTSPAVGFSVDTGGAQTSTGGAEAPEKFENCQIGSSTMRVLDQVVPQSTTANAQKSAEQPGTVGKDIVLGFPENLSDENEGEKLYNPCAPMTASGMVSHLHDEGIVATPAAEDGRAPNRNRLESYITKKTQKKKNSRDDDTLRDVPRTLPDKDYDEFLPPIQSKKSTTKGNKSVMPESDTIKTEEQPSPPKKTVDETKREQTSNDMEDKTPPSQSPEEQKKQ